MMMALPLATPAGQQLRSGSSSSCGRLSLPGTPPVVSCRPQQPSLLAVATSAASTRAQHQQVEPQEQIEQQDASTQQPTVLHSIQDSHTKQQQQQPRSRGAKQKAAATATNTTKRQHKRNSKQRHQQPCSTQDSAALAASKQLTSAISQARSWQQLAQLLAEHSSSMNHIHAAALLSTTSRLVQYHKLGAGDTHEEQQQFAAFYTAALQLAYTQAQGPAARPRELSSMLWAVAKVGLHPGDDWLAAYLAACQPQLCAMNAQDLGLLVWSLARFKLVPEPGFCGELLAATQQQLEATTSCASSSSGAATSSSSRQHRSSGSSGRKGFDAQGLCNVLWGLAVLELHPGSTWLAAAAAAARPLLQGQAEFQPQGIAILLWALAKLGWRPGHDQQGWLDVAADAAARQLYAFKPAELSMLCHALARLHYHPQQAQAQAQQQLQQQTDLEQQEQQQQQLSPSSSLVEQLQAVSWPQLQALRFSEAANLVWALGVMGVRVSDEWAQSAVQQLQDTLHEADAQALASACYGLAKLQHTAEASWWEAVWQHVPTVMGSSAPAAAGAADASSNGSIDNSSSLQALSQSQATFIWAVSKLGVQPPAASADWLFESSQQLLQQSACGGAEVMAYTIAAAMLKLSPPDSWLFAAEEAFTALLLHSCTPLGSGAGQCDATAAASAQQEQVSGAASSAQQQPEQQQQDDEQLAMCHLHTLQQLLGQQPQQPQQQLPHPRLRPKEVSNIVFSFARLRHVPSGPTVAALQSYLQQQQQQQVVQADWQQLRRALQSFCDQHKQRVQPTASQAASQARAVVAAGAAAAAVVAEDGLVQDAGAAATKHTAGCVCGNGTNAQLELHQHADTCCNGGDVAAAVSSSVAQPDLPQPQQQQQLLRVDMLHTP